jgi:acetyl-CoA carboxylase biotin carboxylase subunit
MLKRVLVANRGEIAVRIIRACRELGIETVQACSEADLDALPARLADRSVCIGAAASTASYLNPRFLVSAAVSQGCDAIHPGYGFLSEKPAFAELCAQHGVKFVGPDPQAIALMGDKASARRIAKGVGVPTVPGSGGTLSNADDAAAIAAAIGYPVLLKATAGGGGRGMRVVHEAGALREAFLEASREAQAAFGDGALYLEKFLTQVRHIEIQVLADASDCLHLGERDCSAQRRNQKLLEEGPSPVLDENLRQRMGRAAVRLAKQVGYTSAGTVEFILDPKTHDFYFMEMNTRIQVEHPVTEMLTGVDLVKAQLEIAGGRPLAVRQDDIVLRGHAIECRINAENHEQDFMPCPGLLTTVRWPGGPGVRVDSHLYAGYTVPPFYDSLLAKFVCWGRDRPEAIARMQRALAETTIEGVTTTIPFHQRLLADAAFLRGEIHTRYVEDSFLPSACR